MLNPIRAALVAVLCSAASASFSSGQGFTDGFTTFDTTKWTTAPYTGFAGFAYQGLPDSLAPLNVDGNDVLRMTSVMTDMQRQGFGSIQTFTAPAATLTVDFKTLALHDLSVPAANQSNIDGLLEVYLINPNDQRFLGISIFASSFGDPNERMIQFSDSLGGTSSFTVGWQYDTYYRFVLSSDGTTTHLSFQTSGGSEIAGRNLNQSFASLGAYDIAISQRMGTPSGQYYSDVALNNLDFMVVPEPGTLALCVFSMIAGAVVCAIRKKS